MKKYVILLCCLAAVLMISGCSSLPKEIEPQSLTFANMKMKYAREAQKRQEFARALLLYKDAYDQFTRLDFIRGKINSSLSIARQFFYLDKPEETKKWLNKASDMILIHMPTLETSKSILLMEIAFSKKEYKKVIDIAEQAVTAAQEQNLEWQTEILCYAMVAKAQLKMDYQLDFDRVQTAITRLQKKFEKRKTDDPEVLGFAYYYTGYIYSTFEKNWSQALVFFEKAKEIDSLIDNPYGVGKDLYSLGRCYEELGFFRKAVSSFDRAREVFDLLDNAKMVEKAKKRAESVLKKISLK
jgi:tetratricopeptide (TPR) repeat protein